MPESAGARVDTHVHVHVSELTKEELEAKRQAGVAQEEEDERKKDEEEKTPASIWENPVQSDSPKNVVDLGRNSPKRWGTNNPENSSLNERGSSSSERSTVCWVPSGDWYTKNKHAFLTRLAEQENNRQ